MSLELLVAPMLLAAAAGLVLCAFAVRRRIDDQDPRIGRILYEDVAKPAPPPERRKCRFIDQSGGIETGDLIELLEEIPEETGRIARWRAKVMVNSGRIETVDVVELIALPKKRDSSVADPQLYYVDNQFKVSRNGVPTEVTLILMGKSDRIIRKRDGAIHVIDYKSGQRTDEKVDYYRYQLIAYFFMVEQTYGERAKKAIIDFLEGVDYAEIEDNEETRAECMSLIREMCEMKLGAIPDRLLADLDKPEEAEPVESEELDGALLS